MNAWLGRARAESIIQVALRLGLTIGHDGKSFGPCPSCDRERRSSPEREKQRQIDRRQPCIIRRNEAGHEYWQHVTNGGKGCADGHGDGIALVAWVKCGMQWLRGDKDVEREVRCFFEGNCDTVPHRLRRSSSTERPACTVEAARYLTDAEVREFLFKSCVPVSAAPEVAAYLRDKRGIDPAEVDSRRLAFALPRDRPVPKWGQTRGRPWAATGHQLVLPMFRVVDLAEPKLVVAGLRARRIVDTDDGLAKSLAPCGVASRGLVFAIGTKWRVDGEAFARLTLTEGEMDYLTLGVLTDRSKVGALLGTISGSAQPEYANLIPAHWRVFAAQHNDDSGDSMAKAWHGLLRGRVKEIKRTRIERIAIPLAPSEPPKATGQEMPANHARSAP